jgi:hypothetical protein
MSMDNSYLELCPYSGEGSWGGGCTNTDLLGGG